MLTPVLLTITDLRDANCGSGCCATLSGRDVCSAGAAANGQGKEGCGFGSDGQLAVTPTNSAASDTITMAKQTPTGTGRLKPKRRGLKTLGYAMDYSS
ncbi:hypothetical protein BKA56DRAFT_580798 [Ilyonectria sp. MPI-CAGE-AT-0026]|nr:hypothetical protein BKA56DRAFT_580798 [Ilyonectria sp. MPI-CAGE-AT-0026]